MNSMQSIMQPGALVNIPFTLLAYDPEQIFLSHCTNMSHCTSNLVHILAPHYYTHPSKINKQEHLFIILLQNMCQQQICLSNTIHNMTCAQITQYAFIGGVCK